MEPFDQTNLDTFRLIILRRDGSEILLSPGDCGWSLPSVQARAPRADRSAADRKVERTFADGGVLPLRPKFHDIL